MAVRFGRHVRVVLLGLLPGLGCATSPLTHLTDPGIFRTSASASARPGPELAPAEAAEFCVKLAHDLEREGRDADAAGQYELARHYQPRVDVSRRLAVLYDRLGKADRAMAEYDRALRDHPRDADLLNDFGYHQYNLGRWDDAEKHLRLALKLDPKHPHAWTNLGMTLAQEGRCKESLAAFQHCVGPAEAQCNVAFILAANGKRAEARAAYREALRLDPGSRLAQKALAKLDEPAPEQPAIGKDSHPATVANAGTSRQPHAVVAKDPAASAQPAGESAAGIRTVAAGPADGIAPGGPPSPCKVAAAGGANEWVLPPQGDHSGAKPAAGDGSSAPRPFALVESAVADLPPPTAVASADPGGGIRWVPPPPVPPPALPPDLVPTGRPTPPVMR